MLIYHVQACVTCPVLFSLHEVFCDVSLLDEAHERGVSHDGCLHPAAPHGHATDRHRLCEATAVWRRGEDPAGE